MSPLSSEIDNTLFRKKLPPWQIKLFVKRARLGETLCHLLKCSEVPLNTVITGSDQIIWEVRLLLQSSSHHPQGFRLAGYFPGNYYLATAFCLQ